ncbi:MAG: tRNA preQ1(34) S-adenosylmethionine ribosyltransferase-isomerase QueA [Planctomycetota bacterium]|nr:tRNA preQ1(34) S-adenosylmethionine ribosyltransferase-isomerase QueA [Planctomycetota bacterium]
MELSEFDYDLPKELIAQEPTEERDASRLLVLDRAKEGISHHAFPDILSFLRPDDVLILNDTRVLPARIRLYRETGAKIDALLVRNLEGTTWSALLDTPRKLKIGEDLRVGEEALAKIIKREKEHWVLQFDQPVGPLMNKLGKMPLPPYIRREAEQKDLDRYQTVYAKKEGAIAAPTAGLHFTKEILNKVPCPIKTLTLHVGIGTFKPVKCEKVEDHVMHSEWYEIPPETVDAIEKANRVVVVGTTTCRALETWGQKGTPSGWSDIFLYPPYQFRVVDALVTNFHLPKSTLLMLISALAGKERVFEAYQEAIERKYRFFSYGDAMFIT